MKVAIAGSRRLPKGHAPRLLIRFLAALPEDTTIFMRRGMRGLVPGPFEGDVALLCVILHLEVEWFEPEPTGATRGRSSVYVRDIDMVERADLVIAFVTPDEAVMGYSGTSHVIDRALSAGRPVYAYSVAEDGTVARIGEYDPDHLYADIAPTP